ncbi:MAG: hypothetical protein ACRD16_15795, partial [Thermoanaerobaculia bacterium]
NNPERAAIEAENRRHIEQAQKEGTDRELETGDRRQATPQPLRFGVVVKLMDDGMSLEQAKAAYPGQIDETMWNRAAEAIGRGSQAPTKFLDMGGNAPEVRTPGESVSPNENLPATVPQATAPARVLHDYSSVLKLTPEEAESAAVAEDQHEKTGAIEVFGPEAAKRYEALQRTANGSNHAAADAAFDEVQKMESGLNEAQQKRLFGIGESGYNAEELRAIADATKDYSSEQLAHSSERDLLNVVGREMATGNPGKNAVSAIRLRGAVAELGRRGITAEDAVARGSNIRVARGEASRGDQVDLVRNTLEQLKAIAPAVVRKIPEKTDQAPKQLAPPDLSYEKFLEETGHGEAVEPEGPVDTTFDFGGSHSSTSNEVAKQEPAAPVIEGELRDKTDRKRVVEVAVRNGKITAKIGLGLKTSRSLELPIEEWPEGRPAQQAYIEDAYAKATGSESRADLHPEESASLAKAVRGVNKIIRASLKSTAPAPELPPPEHYKTAPVVEGELKRGQLAKSARAPGGGIR